MARAVDDDAQFWLHSKFIKAEEDVLGDKENNKNGVNAADLDPLSGFPSEFPYEFDSFGSLSSPVESVASSTETESSDEEGFFAGLTRRLSQSSLHETRKQLSVPISTNDKAETHSTWGLVRSPQSTLSGIGSWSGCSAASGDGSPNRSFQVPSPPATQFSAENNAWDIIYAAAGQVARLKMNGEVYKHDFQNRGVLGGLPRTAPAPSVAVKNPTSAMFTNQSHTTLPHLSQVQHRRVRQEHVLKQQCTSVWGRQADANRLAQQQQQEVENRGCDLGYESVKCGRPLSLPQSAWPPLQVKHQNQQIQHRGSGSRGVLQGGSGVKRGCAGTGVFLPRPYGDPPESRKKTNCAPVLLPAKVIHALNLNIDDLNATSQPRFSSAFAGDYDALLARRNALLMQQKLNVLREEAANYEIRLPQEWTY